MIKILLLLVIFVSCAGQKVSEVKEFEERKDVFGKLSSPRSDISGEISMTKHQSGLKIIVEIHGLKPGSVHGLHIHEYGKCEIPDYKSAGGHYNPQGHPHGAPESPRSHAGDLGNVVANAQGMAIKEISFKTSDLDLKNYLGKAVILHAKADDFKSQPSGNSGARIACGILMKREKL